MLQLGNMRFDRGDPRRRAKIVQRYLSVNAPASEVLWLGVSLGTQAGDATAAAAYARAIQSEFPESDQAQMMRSGVDDDRGGTSVGPRLRPSASVGVELAKGRR